MIFLFVFILVKWSVMVYDLLENYYQVLKPDNTNAEHEVMS